MWNDLGGFPPPNSNIVDQFGLPISRVLDSEFRDNVIGIGDPNIVFHADSRGQGRPDYIADKSSRAGSNVITTTGNVGFQTKYSSSQSICYDFRSGTANAIQVAHQEYLEPRQKDWYFKFSIRLGTTDISANRLYAAKDNVNVSRGWLLLTDSTGSLIFAVWTPAAAAASCTTTYNFAQRYCNKWVDVEVGCFNNTAYLFVDNVLESRLPLPGAGCNASRAPLTLGSGVFSNVVNPDSEGSFFGLMSDIVYSIGTPPRGLNRPNILRASPPEADPFFSNVSLLITGVGADSSTIIDNSRYNHTITVGGDAKIDGNSLLFDGTGDYISVAAHTAFDYGTGPFTWEFEYNATSLASFAFVMHQLDATSGTGSGWFFELDSGNKAYVGAGDAPAYQTFVSASINTGTFNKMALVRYGSTGTSIAVYINGSRISTYTAALIGQSHTKTTPLVIGGGGSTFHPTRNLNGRMRNIRITKGVARYMGASYTPPEFPFSGTGKSY